MMAALGLVSGCASGSMAELQPDTFDGTGTIAVPFERYATLMAAGLSPTADLEDLHPPTACVPEDGYEDLTEGSQLLIKSSGGTILGTAELGAPRTRADEGYWGMCAFGFSLNDIPVRGDDIYELSLGSGSRGAIVYTEEELHAGVDVSLD